MTDQQTTDAGGGAQDTGGQQQQTQATQQTQQQTGGGQGGGAQNNAPFYDGWGLDDKAKAFMTGKNFSSIETFVHSAMHADNLARARNVIELPEAGKEGEWNGWSKLGWTEKREDYKIESPKVPEGVEYSKAIEQKIVDVAHAHRVPAAAAKAILDAGVEAMLGDVQAVRERGALAQKDLDTKLRADWGDRYDANVEIARRGAMAYGFGEPESAELEKIVGSPRLAVLFHKIGETVTEDQITGGSSRSGAPMNPQAAGAELARLHGDPEFLAKLNDTRHPGHKGAMAERDRLIALKAKG